MRKLKRLSFLIVLLIIFSLISLPSVYAETIVDSQTLRNSDDNLEDHHPSDSADRSAVSQSFLSPGRYNITALQFWCDQDGAPTGNGYARLYAHSGTFGTSSLPTGAALATSDAVDVSLFNVVGGWYMMNFTGANVYEVQPDTHYVLVWENPAAGNINAANYVKLDRSTVSGHAGNWGEYVNGAWTANAALDLGFYLYGDLVNNNPTLVNASIPDMDDTDNCYAMTYYSLTTVVADADNATDIERIYVRILQESAIRAEVWATDLNTGTPIWAIALNGTIIDLNSTACSFTENGVNGTAVFSVAFEWDYTQENDLEIAVYAEDASSVSVGWTTLQNNYTDVITRLVTHNFGANVSTAVINSPIELSGYVRYATEIDGYVASSTSPPDAQFTSVQIQNHETTTVGTDGSIVDGYFSAAFNASPTIGSTQYYAYLDLVPDYTDGLAIDGDVVSVFTTRFYLAEIIEGAFATFGIIDYLANATAYGTAMAAYFVDSISNIMQLVTQQFLLILGIFDFFIDWYTRMMSLVVSIGNAITGLLDGTGTITTGLGNVWTWISFGAWIDIVPVFLFIWWVDSITKRGERQGEITVFFGDMSTIFNVTSWFLSMFGLIINTVTDLAFRLLEVIT